MRQFHRRHINGGGIPDEQQKDYVICAVCNTFPVPNENTPGENFPTTFTTTGTTYVWTNADDDIADLDLRVTPVPAVGQACPFCGTTRYLDGNRGSGSRIP